MSDVARFLWGKSKMEKVQVTKYIDLDNQSSDPTFKNGRMFMDANFNLKIGQDGSTFVTVTAT